MKSLQQSSDVRENKICQDLGVILKNQLFTDVILIANGKEYPAHKTVLSTRSPVFAAMFASKMKEVENNRVEIEDIDDEVLENMLSYIYTGRCENKLADKLLVVAEKYDLQMLKKICEDELIENLSLEKYS
ncbi:Zinc finger and BTB domain-containing protein 7A [Sarracenia purpurea var. burkii]